MSAQSITGTRKKNQSPAPVTDKVIKGGPTRRGVSRERSEQLESRVLEAAIEEFAEHGFAGARIERISQRAATVDRMLYYYYGNKERLYQAEIRKKRRDDRKHIKLSDTVKRTTFPLVETVATILANGQTKGVFRQDTTSEHVLMTIMSLGFFYVSNQYTCSTWMGGDVMTRNRRTAWRGHICEVVLDHLQPKVIAVAVTTVAKKRSTRK